MGDQNHEEIFIKNAAEFNIDLNVKDVYGKTPLEYKEDLDKEEY